MLLWAPRGKDPHTFWGCNCSFWSLNYVPVLLLTSFWRSFLFLHRVLLSTVQGQVAPQNITTNQNFLSWSLHSLESNCYQNKSTATWRGLCRETLVRNLRYWKRAWLTQQVFLRPAKLRCGYRLPERCHKIIHQAHCFPVTKCGSHTFAAL